MWQAYACVIEGPGLGTRPATLEEVKAALRYDKVEAVDDDGIFLIPLTEMKETEVRERGYIVFEENGVEFSVEMP
jgi:NAD(P)H-hydrate repair Nnr-like enzyme with NAD(P)H-hydrate dehydratase domain